MKLTRRQLNYLIKESLSIKNEGFFDTIKKGVTSAASSLAGGATVVFDYLTGETEKRRLTQASSPDAYELFDAMLGLGTDEEKVKQILESRGREGSLVELYQEYSGLVMELTSPDAFEELYNKIPADDIETTGRQIGDFLRDYNTDLIGWLESDGMDDEAEMIMHALKESGVRRNEKPGKNPESFAEFGY